MDVLRRWIIISAQFKYPRFSWVSKSQLFNRGGSLWRSTFIENSQTFGSIVLHRFLALFGHLVLQPELLFIAYLAPFFLPGCAGYLRNPCRSSVCWVSLVSLICFRLLLFTSAIAGCYIPSVSEELLYSHWFPPEFGRNSVLPDGWLGYLLCSVIYSHFLCCIGTVFGIYPDSDLFRCRSFCLSVPASFLSEVLNIAVFRRFWRCYHSKKG